MSQPFNPNTGLVVIPAAIHGPAGIARVALAVDTGATGTLINAGPLMSAGYDPALSTERVQVTTGSSVEFAARVPLERIEALAQRRDNFSVLCHTLPPSTMVDGVLGLDYFRGKVLTIDFDRGLISLQRRRRRS